MPNNNENTTVTFCQKFWQLNWARFQKSHVLICSQKKKKSTMIRRWHVPVCTMMHVIGTCNSRRHYITYLLYHLPVFRRAMSRPWHCGCPSFFSVDIHLKKTLPISGIDNSGLGTRYTWIHVKQQTAQNFSSTLYIILVAICIKFQDQFAENHLFKQRESYAN